MLVEFDFSGEAPDILLEDATSEERHTIAGWVREAIAENKQKEPHIDYIHRWCDGFSFEEEVDYTDRFTLQWLGSFLLQLEEDTLDDEAYLRICHETGRVADAVERLLELGRIDEAAQEMKRASDYDLLSIANLFVEAGQDAMAEQIMQQRAWKSQDSRLLEWLKNTIKRGAMTKTSWYRRRQNSRKPLPLKLTGKFVYWLRDAVAGRRCGQSYMLSSRPAILAKY